MTRGNKIKGTKRSKTKIIALVLIFILVLIAVAAVFFFLSGQNSDEKRKYEEKLSQEINTFTDGQIAKLDKVDTSDDGLHAADQESLKETEAVVTDAEKKMLETELAKQGNERKQQILKTLTAAYSQALQAQKKEALSQVEALANQGKADFAALSANGENTAANKGLLASEYLAKSKVLEGRMDASFQALLTKMEAQLKAEGIDPDPIIKAYEGEYKRIKEESRSAMMSKALNSIKN